MAHKITAIRLKKVGDDIVLEGMTSSPRGTRIIAKSYQFLMPVDDKPALRAALLLGVNELTDD